MNDRELDRALADFGATRVHSMAPPSLRQRVAAMPLPSELGTDVTPTPMLRFRSAFGPATFVLVSVVLVLFGGLLLTGALTQPSDGPMPAAVTESPDPTADLLPGVELTTEELEPGVYRVLSDGVSSLARFEPDGSDAGQWFAVSAGVDGSVWLRASDSVRRLGQERAVVAGGEAAPATFESLKVGAQGTLWSIAPDDAGDYAVWSFDASEAQPEWQRWEFRAGTVRLDDFGGFWEVGGGPDELTVTRTPADDGGWRTLAIPGPFSESAHVLDGDGGAVFALDPEMGVIAYQDGEGWRRVRTPDGLGFELGHVGHDGTAWVRLSDGLLARFDGSEWATFDDRDTLDDDPTDQMSSWFGVGPDGSLWESGPRCNGLRRFDGRAWTTYLEGMCPTSMAIDGDGIVWATAGDPATADESAEPVRDTVELYAITYQPSDSSEPDAAQRPSGSDQGGEPSGATAPISALDTATDGGPATRPSPRPNCTGTTGQQAQTQGGQEALVRTTRIGIASTLAGCLAAGSALGVAGQEGIDTAAAPTIVSGTSVLIDNNGPVVMPPPGMEELRRDQELIVRYDMDDDRLSGEATILSNADKWLTADGDDIGIGWASVLLENDGGTWEGAITTTDGQSDAYEGEIGGLIELTGSGDYAGWSAILYEFQPADPDASDATPVLVNGLIFPGDLPPNR